MYALSKHMFKLCLTFYFLSAYAFTSIKALKILIFFAGGILAINNLLTKLLTNIYSKIIFIY